MTEATTKPCAKCKTVKPLNTTEFRYFSRKDRPGPRWASYCRECERGLQKAVRGEAVRRGKDALPQSIPAEKHCPGCKEVKPSSEFHRRVQYRHIALVTYCKPCSKARRRNWQAKNREKSNARARRYYSALRSAAKAVAVGPGGVVANDVLRRALIEKPAALNGERELAAYFRGFVAGARRTDAEGVRFDRLKDLVHRIAAESKSARGIGYEDAVSHGYEGLLVFLRKRVPAKNEEHERKLAAQAIRWAITDAKREFGGLKRDGGQRFPIPESSLSSPDEPLPSQGVQARSGEEHKLPDALDHIQLDPRERRILEGVVAGMTWDEVGARENISGSRACQIAKRLGERFPKLLEILAAGVSG